MIQALLSGISGIQAQQTRMNSIGNNIANVNTSGFKSASVEFEDLLSQTLSGASGPNGKNAGLNPTQIGLGVRVSGISSDMGQGSLNATNRPSDLAIQGNGMFVVTDGDTIKYTRDGGFDVDASGDLVMRGTTLKVVGYNPDATGKIDTKVDPTAASTIKIPFGSKAIAQATANVTLNGNLKGDADATETWSTQMRVYDSQGGPHDLTLVFSNRQSPATGGPAGSTSSWDWKAFEGNATTGTAIGDSTTAGNEKLFFDANGKLSSGLAAGVLNKIIVPGAAGAPSTTINLALGGISQLKASSQVVAQGQDGFPSGTLQSFSIGGDGMVRGVYSNGQTQNLAQVALAGFVNPGGLARSGSNLWDASANSGKPAFGVATGATFGKLSSGFLEQSNVDISKEFTDLIVTQRGFQANTKIVTTVDELLQEVINMKR